MYSLLRPLLFRMSPERAHTLTLHTLSTFPWFARLVAPRWTATPSLHQTLWNQPFPHPIGLAAGLDKNGVAVDGLFGCGFSHVEVGTVTPRPQPGNPQPRLFRLKEDEALVNRMGFNNDGAPSLCNRLKNRRMKGVVGVNLGKNKDTPNEEAGNDYVTSLQSLYSYADYIVINVSSPNTPGLRDLQSESALVPLVAAVIQERDAQYEARKDRIRPHRPPVLVKLAPDLSDDAIASLASSLVQAGVEGFVATNTTIERKQLQSPSRTESGGLSGKPLAQRSTDVIRLLYQTTAGQVPIIGCGGVFSAHDAYEKILAGASLVQIYTGFIYRGPRIVREISMGLSSLLAADGYASVADAVGQGTKSAPGDVC